ncbi:hypothetical protein V6N13_087757 [Hibiscus sabdariffa]|uniref:Uncharacterized protein n=1 Tax=Hibiscus sabdariffa TaxID=183260 RepID=A0ABR2FXK6_9ROSI
MLASRVASGRSKPSVLTQAINLRPRLKSRLPQHIVGNLICNVGSTYNSAKRDIELDHLAYLLKFMTNQYNPLIHIATRGEFNIFVCTNWLNTLDGNSVDFGWGEPTSWNVWRTEIQYHSFSNAFVLKEMVTLEAKTMHVLEHNSEFLAFASPASGPTPYPNKSKV